MILSRALRFLRERFKSGQGSATYARKKRRMPMRRHPRMEWLESRSLLTGMPSVAPIAADGNGLTLHDQSYSSAVYGYDLDGDALSYTLSSGPANGNLSFDSSGGYTYTPNASFVGTDSFDFSVSDGLSSDTGTVWISVYNGAPVASDGYGITLHDQSYSSAVYGYDLDGDSLSYSLSSGPANGSLSFDSSGGYTYTPNVSFVGADSFEFSVSDGLSSDTGTVWISVYNGAPVASDSYGVTLHDQAYTSAVYGYDPDGDSLTYGLASGPGNGSLSFNSDGSYTYTPNASFVGADSFEFNVSDGLSSGAGTVWISVYNGSPVAYDSTSSILHDQSLTSSVSAFDPDGDTLSFAVFSGPSNGTVSFSADGSFTYIPSAGFLGWDSFEFQASDGIDADTGTFTIHVYNNAPFAFDDTFIYPDPGVEYIDIDVLGNDYDPDGDDLTIQSVTTPSDGGTAIIVGNKIRYYPPASYYSNSDPTIDTYSTGTLFTYTVVDVLGATAFADVKADAKRWDAWREYSRGNDDPNESIYETGKIKAELIVDVAMKKIFLKYTATSTATSLLRWVANPVPGQPPILQNVTGNPAAAGATPEYQIFQPFLFLQPAAGAGAVAGGAAGVNLAYAAGGGGTLSGQIEVGSWVNNPTELSGTAVIQMRLRTLGGVPVFTDPAAWPPAVPVAYAYDAVRQEIPWKVKFETVEGALREKETTLDVTEVPYGVVGVVGQIATPLRIINSSNREGEVYKVGYPAKPGVARKDANPAVPGAQDDPAIPGDQRAEPANPIQDWNTKVKAKTK